MSFPPLSETCGSMSEHASRQSARRRFRRRWCVVARPAGVSSLASLGVALGGPAKRGQEHDALARSVRREERRYLVVIEGESGGAESLGVRGQVQLPADDAGFELGGAVAAVAETLQDTWEISQTVDVYAGVGGELLAEPEVASLPPEVPLLQQLEGLAVPMEHVRAGR